MDGKSFSEISHIKKLCLGVKSDFFLSVLLMFCENNRHSRSGFHLHLIFVNDYRGMLSLLMSLVYFKTGE